MWVIIEADPKQGPPPTNQWYPEARVFYALDPSEVVQRVVRAKKDLEFSTREEAADYSERLGRRFLQKVLADVM